MAELVCIFVFLAARAQKQWAIPTGVTMAISKQPAFWVLGTEKTGSQEWTLQEVGGEATACSTDTWRVFAVLVT